VADDLEIVRDIPRLSARPAAMHKGEAGSVFCVAGAVGMVGAATLCGRSALRAGAGLVRIGMPWRIAAIAMGRDPNLMLSALPETEDGTISAMAPPRILKACEGFEAMLIGPGLSTNPQTVQAVKALLPQLNHRLVLDADALNAIALDKCECLKELNRDQGPPVITPHPGEMIRLLGDDYDGVQLQEGDQHRRDVAVFFARRHGAVVVLKGHRTVVTDGKRLYFNTTGNPGMAKAGMGDVLAGVIAALRAQGLASFEAAVLGAHLHGLAGDMVRDRMGEIGILATDVIEELPFAARRLQNAESA
jgi:hydroxyethylthiazole kinase-like uncharacterized protein yjeF